VTQNPFKEKGKWHKILLNIKRQNYFFATFYLFLTFHENKYRTVFHSKKCKEHEQKFFTHTKPV